MKRRVYDWSSVFTVIFTILLVSAFLLSQIASDEGVLGEYITKYKTYIAILVLFLSLFVGFNQQTTIDTSKNLISSPMFYIFRKNIKLSEIERYDESVDTKMDKEGNITYTYILTLYGAFGAKKFKFSSQTVMRNVINNLNNLS